MEAHKQMVLEQDEVLRQERLERNAAEAEKKAKQTQENETHKQMARQRNEAIKEEKAKQKKSKDEAKTLQSQQRERRRSEANAIRLAERTKIKEEKELAKKTSTISAAPSTEAVASTNAPAASEQTPDTTPNADGGDVTRTTGPATSESEEDDDEEFVDAVEGHTPAVERSDPILRVGSLHRPEQATIPEEPVQASVADVTTSHPIKDFIVTTEETPCQDSIMPVIPRRDVTTVDETVAAVKNDSSRLGSAYAPGLVLGKVIETDLVSNRSSRDIPPVSQTKFKEEFGRV